MRRGFAAVRAERLCLSVESRLFRGYASAEAQPQNMLRRPGKA